MEFKVNVGLLSKDAIGKPVTDGNEPGAKGIGIIKNIDENGNAVIFLTEEGIEFLKNKLLIDQMTGNNSNR